jgi:glycosyltransferase involved in cell wall biosynthesis
MYSNSTYSVIMTAFNAEDTIEEALKSALAFDIPASRIVVVDDNSADSTVTILQNYVQKDSRVNLVCNSSNLGQSKSRNIGVNIAKSEFLIFMDDDDFSFPNRASLHLEALISGHDISYVSTSKQYAGGYRAQFENSEFTFMGEYQEELMRYLLLGEKQNLFSSVFSPSCAMAARRSSFLSLGGFSEEMRRLEDIDFVCRAIEAKLHINWSPKVALLRLHTLGEDKTFEANAKGELALLDAFANYFTQRERLSFQTMVRIRSSYFSRKPLSLLLSLPQVFFLLFIDPKRIISILNRLVHDYRRKI